MASNDYDTFEAVQRRLDEIVEAVRDDNLPLDDALALYEEAVSLGLRGSDLLEENIEAFDAQQAAAGEGAAEGAEGVQPADEAAAAGASEDAAADGAAGEAAAVQQNEKPQAVAGEIR